MYLGLPMRSKKARGFASLDFALAPLESELCVFVYRSCCGARTAGCPATAAAAEGIAQELLLSRPCAEYDFRRTAPTASKASTLTAEDIIPANTITATDLGLATLTAAAFLLGTGKCIEF